MRNKIFGRRPVSERRRAANRPEFVDKIPRRVLFSTVGSTGWRRRRDISAHKDGLLEGDFSHLHGRFADPEDAA
jgi:hypothetical protein